jgi:protein SCO1/2
MAQTADDFPIQGRMRTGLATIATLLLLFSGAVKPALAALSETDLVGIDAAPTPGIALPGQLLLQGENGEIHPIQAWWGPAPSIWIVADYTCQTLCGPVISIVSEALSRSRLRPGQDFRLIVVGLDPRDTAADAATMKRAQVGTNGDLAAHTYFLRGTAPTIARLTDAFGFRSAYDREHDQFAHPAVAYVVTPEGRIARALSGLALDPTDLRLALVDAGQGRIGTWTDHIRLMCYGFDPAKGIYTAAVGRMLSTASAITVLALGLVIWLLRRRETAPRG